MPVLDFKISGSLQGCDSNVEVKRFSNLKSGTNKIITMTNLN